ncbi:MAG: membrane-bound lytic murein transglycosylase MltF [Gammaproteobacteria bacterium]|nr:membrane-bound lytic murein transglycosylase MltF [Gammaproteobacteria bacterium]
MTTATSTNTAIKPLILFAFSAGFAALLGLAWLLRPAPAVRPLLDQIQERGVLRVLTKNGPTTYYEAAEGMAGLEYELALAFARRLKVRLEMITTDSYPEIRARLEAGEADLAAAGLALIPPRQKELRFGPGYQEVRQKLVYRQGQRAPRNLNELDGELRVQAHSAQAETLLALKSQYPGLHWTEASDASAEDLLNQVLSGELIYTVVDSHELDLFRAARPEAAVAFELGLPQSLAWAFPVDGDDSLYAEALAFFGELRVAGHLAQLQDRYYGHLNDFDYVNTREFLSAIEQTLPKFQDHFQDAAGADMDWRLLAAIGYQESLWDPAARSRTGVRGMMMLTENTAESLGVTRRTDARQSIRGGAEYLRQLRGKVPNQIAEPDRTWFALAAYNVGWGHLGDARALTEAQGANPNAWSQVKERLPLLAQKKWHTQTAHGYARGYEPVRFVEAIRRYQDTLNALYTPDGKSKTVAKTPASPAPAEPVAALAPVAKTIPAGTTLASAD